MRITISIKSQTLRLNEKALAATYPVSTALAGTGQQKGSGQTPLGKHIIRAKIGEGCPQNAVFVGRRWTGEVYTAELAAAAPGRDWILSRILWLSGLEPGKNRGGDCDTMRRYIYIHGTPYENQIGQPVSHGCVRMNNADLLALFDVITTGTLVTIQS